MELKNNIPRHEQISNWLRDQISKGIYTNEEKLPSEQELSKKFEVSRVTVRHALRTLETDRLIYRCQGIGSFVKPGKTTPKMIRLTDFMEDMREAGKAARSEVTALEQEPACDLAAHHLNVKPGQQVLRLERVRYGDGEPVALDITWFPIFYGQLIVDHDLAEDTIYRILEDEYEIPITRGSYTIQACLADARIAGHLGIRKGAPLLLFDRSSMTINDKPVYFQRRYYRADKISWQVNLERGAGEAPGSDLPLKKFAPVFR
ncbi:MAG: GntR family transcriptional regulator [Cyclonatronaceae bacterium]